LLSERNHIDDHAPLQAAAQADYERRILSAIDMQPVSPDVEILIAALEEIANTKLDVTRYFSGPHPADELDAMIPEIDGLHLIETAAYALRAIKGDG
jgi:hypothetical protein